MPVTEMSGVVDAAAREVLETMFFTMVEECEEPFLADTPLAATVRFTGDRSGSLSLALSDGAARSIAANFLGENELALSDAEVSSVMCELANMICGAAVSRLDVSGDFLLEPPVCGWTSPDEVALELPLGEELGPLRLAFHLDPPARRARF